MAHVRYVKRARKDYPQYGVKKGESYYWWSFAFGDVHVSKKPPKPSQTTNSEFLAKVYATLELGQGLTDANSLAAIKIYIAEAAKAFDELGDECERKYNNLPKYVKTAAVPGELLRDRAEACRYVARRFKEIKASDSQSALRQIQQVEYIGK